MHFSVKSWNIPKMSPKPKTTSRFFYDTTETISDHNQSQNSGFTDGHFSSGWVASQIQIYEEARKGQSAAFSQQPNRLTAHPSGITSSEDGNHQSSNPGLQANNKRRSNYPDYPTLSKVKSPPANVVYGLQNDRGTLRGRAGIRNGGFKPGVNAKDPWMQEQLHNKLLSYSMFGMPRLSSTACKFWEIREGEESSIYLESSWKEIVLDHEAMTRKQNHQQEAIWELLHTELSYLKKLKVITDLFICGLINLQQHGILKEVSPESLFSNIPEIIRVHRKLWWEVMAPTLQKVRMTGKPFHPLSFVDGFRKFSERFTPYIQYCMEEEKCMENSRILLRDNELFLIYVKWAETHKQCNRLRLVDMLVKPHQRITKYPLLLKAILKRTEDPDDRDALFRMISNTEQFLHYINSKMMQREEQQKLAAIACRIGAYEVLEPVSEEVEKHVKEFCSLNLTSPITGVGPDHIRQLLLEGTLKMKENKDSKMEVYCFLFTDVFLITKLMKKTEMAKVIRQPLMVEQIVCRELKDPGAFLVLYLNEFQCITFALTFQTSSSKDRTMWVEAINNTKDQLRKMKMEEADNREKELQRIIEDTVSQNNVPLSGSPQLPHQKGKGKEMQQLQFTTVKPRMVITVETDALTDEDDSMDINSTDPAQPAVRRTPSPTSKLGSNSAAIDLGTELAHTSEQAFANSFASPQFQRRRALQKKRKGHVSSTAVNVLDTAESRHQFAQMSRPHGIIKAQDLLGPLGNNPYNKLTSRITLKEDEYSNETAMTDDDDDDSSVSEVFIFSEPNLSILNPENRSSPTVVETLLRAQAMERKWKNYCGSDTMSFVSDNMSEFSDMEELDFIKGKCFDNTEVKATSDNELFCNEVLEIDKLTSSINSAFSEAEYGKIPMQSKCFPSNKEPDFLVPETASVDTEELSGNYKESEFKSGKVYPCATAEPPSLHLEEIASADAGYTDLEISSAIQKPRLLSTDDILTGNHNPDSSRLTSEAYQHFVSREMFSEESTEEMEAHVTPDRILTVADVRRLRSEQQGFSC